MRINVYSQEITPEIIVEWATSSGTGRAYVACRFMLRSPDVLHHTAEDDDRSAVTFWPADDGRTMDRFAFARILRDAAGRLEAAGDPERGASGGRHEARDPYAADHQENPQ